MDRRRFLQATALGATACTIGTGWAKVFTATAGTGPYGPLGPPDANGVQLPAGFSSRVIGTTGQVVPGTSYSWHLNPDGGATFPTSDGGWIYVSNSEAPAGGAGMVRFSAAGQVVDARRVLNGTVNNCAGGPTPWGTWLSCEETPTGRVWECDPAGLATAVARPAMGAFTHEAATVDPVRGHLYLTEDAPDGGLYRFIPTTYPDLAAGTLQVMTKVGGVLGWATVPDPDGVPVPCKQQVPTMKVFNGGEGLWFDTGKVYFTTKGDNVVRTYDPVANVLAVVYDAATSPTPELVGVDNVTVAPSGDVYVAEDGGNMELVILSPEGDVAPFLRLGVTGSEMTGPAFDPSGTRLYFSSQRNPGRTYEIRGPFRTSGPTEVFAFGNAPDLGPNAGQPRPGPLVGMASTPSGNGYWLVASDGGIFAYGDARFLGSTGGTRLNRPVVGIAATPTGNGYWLVASDGGIFAYGDARFLGSTGGTRLNQPVVGMAATPSGNGYWLVASDGGIFAYGDARFLGSTGGTRLNRPVVGMAATPTGNGYWLVASDGGIFAYGDAPFLGSTGSVALVSPIVGMDGTQTGAGYRFVAGDGGVFCFGDAPFISRPHPGLLASRRAVAITSGSSRRGYWVLASR